MVRKYACYLVGVVAAGLVVPSGSWGQAAKAKKAVPAGPVEIEEITVTAQKREESIQEIPVSVTALSGAALEEKGVVDLYDLQTTVPNLRTTQSSLGGSSFDAGMRGTANVNNAVSQSSTIGLYLDGVYIAKNQANAMDLEDLERVEVLRGPQGTLFGRNTIGGAINLITKKPTEERSIIASTEVGNFDAFKGRVTLNVPLIGKNGFFQSDAIGTLSLRENAVYRSHEPYYDNKSPTNVKESGAAGYNNLNRVLNMTSLRWQPIKDVTVDYAFEYHRWRMLRPDSQLTHIEPGGAVDNKVVDLNPYLRPNRVDSFGTNMVLDNSGNLHRQIDSGNNRIHLLTAAWDLAHEGALGNVTLKSTSAYRSMTNNTNSELDGSPLHVADFTEKLNVDHWSEELQMVGTAPRVHYVLGGYYYGEHDTSIDTTMIYSGDVNQYNIVTGHSYALAGYGQATYTPPILNDKLSATAGLRFTYEHVHMHKNFQCNYVTVPGLQGKGPNFCDLGIIGLADFNVSRGKSFGVHGTAIPGLSPMANLQYQWTDNVMTYFKVSRGFQSGNINTQASDPRLFTPFNPEKLWAYEGGIKSQWFDNRLRINADGFLSRYTDQVVSVTRFDQLTGNTVNNENAGKSEFWGFEVEAVALPVRGVEATLSYAYLNTRYLEWKSQKFAPGGLPVFDPVTGKPVQENVAMDRDVAFSPDHSIAGGLTYTAPPTTAGVFSAHIDAYWQDRTVNHPVRPQYDADPDFVVINGRLQFVDIPLQKGSLDIAAYCRNMADWKYRSAGIDLGGLGWSVNTFGDPRTFGLQLTYNFAEAPAAPAPPPPVAQAAPPPPAPAKKKIVLRSVHFDFDKATLKAETKPILDEAVQVLKQEGSVDIVVEGHTDSVGTDQYNLGLSRRRAETVRTYLVDHGVARSRITAEGMGESKPVASNDTADGRAQNRRVELHVK